MKSPRLGLVEYINALPFTAALHTGAVTLDADIAFGTPAHLNRAMRNTRLDVSIISTYEYLTNKEQYTLLPSLCIGAPEAVYSVCLFTRYAPDELSEVTIGLTGQSATSVALLKVLCSQLWDVTPTYEVLEDSAAAAQYDAYLLIGDDCMLERPPEGYHRIDLVEGWRKLTGVAFCFAVFAAQQSYFDKHKDLLMGIEAGLLDALEWSEDNKEMIIALAQETIALPAGSSRATYRQVVLSFLAPKR